MKSHVSKTNMPVVTVDLEEGEKVFSETGGMSWMSETIKMETNTRGGVMKALGRMVSGESIFLNTFTGPGKIAFSSEFPGSILHKKLDNNMLICQKDAFMFAEEGVKLSMHFHKRLGAGLFGGEGFILQKVEGKGDVFFELDGEIVEQELSKGEVLLVDPGHLAVMESTVDYSITTVKGIKNMFLGGEGLFFAKLTGPGKVWLQSMPLRNFVHKIIPMLPRKRD